MKPRRTNTGNCQRRVVCNSCPAALRKKDGGLLPPPRHNALSAFAGGAQDLSAAESRGAKTAVPGYVFASFGADRRLLVVKSRQVVRLLAVKDQVRFVEEIGQIRRALDMDPGLGACAAVKRGTRVRILRGPFQGLEGVVSTLKGQTRIVLNVDIIGRP